MAMVDDIRAIEKLADFKGGMMSQREHLNKAVGAINAIIEAANREVFRQLFAANNTETLYYVKAGILYTGNFQVSDSAQV